MKVIRKIKEYKSEHTTKETFSWLKRALLSKIKIKKRPNNFRSIKIKEKEGIIYKSNPKVFIFANVPFYDIGGGQRSSQLCKTFNKMGYSVYCIYAFQSCESTVYKLEMPLCMHEHISKITKKDIEKLISKDDIVIFEAPIEKFSLLIDEVVKTKAHIVYENIDNWETSLGDNFLKKDVLNKMIKNSNILVGSAKPLVKQLEKYSKELNINPKVLYLANAVDDELFSPLKDYEQPEDLVVGKKTLIYYGSLWGSWFDWELIKGLANKHKDYSFNMIGDTKNIIDLMKTLPKNIHFLGLKKQSDLPAYLKYSDYALIPFKVDEIGEYVSPLKIFEYISMNKKVLCTKLPDVVGYPNTYLGNTVKEWEKFIEDDTPVDKTAANNFILHNTWCSRVSALCEEINKDKAIKCNNKYYKKISIVVNDKYDLDILDKCVETLLFFKKRYEYQVVVLTNKSKNLEYLNKKYKKQISVINTKKQALTEGFGNTKGEYVLFLNSNQMAMNEFFIDPYIEVLEYSSKTGAIGVEASFKKNGKIIYTTIDKHIYPNVIARSDIESIKFEGTLLKREVYEKVKAITDEKMLQKIKELDYEIYYCPYLGIMSICKE